MTGCWKSFALVACLGLGAAAAPVHERVPDQGLVIEHTWKVNRPYDKCGFPVYNSSTWTQDSVDDVLDVLYATFRGPNWEKGDSFTKDFLVGQILRKTDEDHGLCAITTRCEVRRPD